MDVELGSSDILREVTRAVRHARKTLIVSFHDFARTPPYRTLVRKLREAQAAGADIIKIATHADSDDDVTGLARLLVQHPAVPLIAVAMDRWDSSEILSRRSGRS